MPTPEEPPPESEADFKSPFLEVRYSLPALLHEVKRDRASAAFAMEKLDQTTINLLFDQQRAHRDANPDK